MARTDLVSFEDRQIDQHGNTILTADQFVKACLDGKTINDQVYVTGLNADIRQYNRYTDKKVSIYQGTECYSENAFKWLIPPSYLTINLGKYVADKLSTEIDNGDLSDQQIDDRIERVKFELKLVKKHDLTNLFRCLIYVIDRLTEQSKVWGLGRGSSVASYVLYLIGVHDVDSVRFDIDPLEFYKTQ